MQKKLILKNDKGSITLFVLLSALFFLVIVASVGVSMRNKERRVDAEFDKIKLSYEKEIGNEDAVYYEKMHRIETEQWVPTGAEITNYDLTKGLTIRDSNGNEWVWIEVPKSVTASATNDEYIEIALRNYANEVVTRPADYSDTNHAGTGLTDSEYNAKKSKMLQSIKTYGGFYIGKYETGYKENNARSASGDTTQTAVIQQDAYPYNYVTCSQAENLAEGLNPSGATTTSLMFGIQWDLTLRYLKEKGKLTDSQLTNWSSMWGNYMDNRDNDTKLEITSEFAKKSTASPYNVFESIKGTKSNIIALLTTGASDTASRLNVYDFAGNLSEFTLEKYDGSYGPCTVRGGSFISDPLNGSAAHERSYYTADETNYDTGFRVSLY